MALKRLPHVQGQKGYEVARALDAADHAVVQRIEGIKRRVDQLTHLGYKLDVIAKVDGNGGLENDPELVEQLATLTASELSSEDIQAFFDARGLVLPPRED